MAGFQFGHISTFSFKGNTANFSIDEVAAEAARLPGSHPHVAEPLPPTVLAGDFAPEQVPEEIRRRVAEAKAALKGVRSADGKVQRIRGDTHVMEAQVHSHPIYTKAPPPEHQGEDRPSVDDPIWHERYLKWRSELVWWIKQDASRRGLDVLSVVEHLDEAHPHIHALLVPRRTQQNPRMDAKATHPGHAAQARRRAQARERLTSAALAKPAVPEPEHTERTRTRRRRGTDIGRRDSTQPKRREARRKAGEPATLEQLINQIGTRAYKAAMRGWQSNLYENHSFRHGLARVGPGLERLSRRAWWQRQTESEAVLNKKELTSTLATVVGNFGKDAVNAERRRQAAEAEAVDLEREIGALKAELATAQNTIRQAEELPQVIQSLKAEEEAGRQRLSDISAEVAEADRKLKQAQEADAARTKAEEAAADAEKRRQAAEAAVASLKQREALVRRDRKEIEQEKAQIKDRERNLKAMLRGLAAWATGRLIVSPDNRLAILSPKADRDPADELASLAPVEEWLVGTVKRLDSMFTSRLTKAIAEAKKVMAATIRAWSTGLIYRDERLQAGVRIRASKPDAAEKLFKETAGHNEILYSTLPLLPDLTAVHDVIKRAEEMRATLDAAELRELNTTAARLRELRRNGPGQR